MVTQPVIDDLSPAPCEGEFICAIPPQGISLPDLLNSINPPRQRDWQTLRKTIISQVVSRLKFFASFDIQTGWLVPYASTQSPSEHNIRYTIPQDTITGRALVRTLMSHFADRWVNTELGDWADALPTLDWTANVMMALLGDVESDHQEPDEDTCRSESGEPGATKEENSQCESETEQHDFNE